MFLKKLDLKEKEKIVELWKTGNYSCADIGRLFDVHRSSVTSYLRQLGFDIPPAYLRRRKYFIHEDYFDNIDNEHKAYILGLMYADGYNNTAKSDVTLSLQEDDEHILKTITELIQPGKPLRYTKSKNIKRKTMCRLVIENKHISNRLSELGCMKNKTFLITFPTFLRKKLIPHFIRGYFDGDGYISDITKYCDISIVGTQLFCESLKEILEKKLKIHCGIGQRHKNRDTNTRHIRIGGKNNVSAFLEYIYKDSLIYLERKKLRANILLERKNFKKRKNKS